MFLWKEGTQGHYFAKVAWGKVCRPKEEGGLGLKNIQEWNLACMVRHVWDIARNKDTMWVKWIDSNRLHSQNIWQYRKSKNDPWFWNKLLEIRGQIQDKYKIAVGNGASVSFWFDNWSDICYIWNYLEQQERSVLAVPVGAKLADIGNINLPGIRRQSNKILKIHEVFRRFRAKSCKNDEWKWEDTKEGFSIGGLWENTRIRWDRVRWADLLWESQGLPRHDFIFWLLLQEKICTKDKIKEWGGRQDDNCVFCSQQETNRHLFLECDFAKEPWNSVWSKAELEGKLSDEQGIVDWWIQ